MSRSDETYDLGLLERSIAKWRSSPALREVYGDIYRAMARCAPAGPALELGSGIGVMREFVSGVITTDVHRTRFVECAASAYAVEDVPGGPWSAVYMLDVLHHLREPFRFFASAARALAPGGRIIICDPAATLVGRLVYRAVHHEPAEPAKIVSPYHMPPDNEAGEFANMGMAWALFARDRSLVEPALRSAGLGLVDVRFRDPLSYLLTGGFSHKALLPAGVMRCLIAGEKRVPQSILRLAALRMIVVLERRDGAHGGQKAEGAT